MTQGQASDIIIQANEIKKTKENLNQLYVLHTGQPYSVIGEFGALLIRLLILIVVWRQRVR